MGVSRRRFFKGLVGGLGSLGLANVILSQQGWLRFFQVAKAHADIPPPYNTYTLKPQFQFFETMRDNAPVPARDALDLAIPQRVRDECARFVPSAPKIIEYASGSPSAARSIVRVYELSPAAAFVTRLLLMGVDVSTLSQMYASRFGVTASAAQTAINNFINRNNFFHPHTYPRQDLTLSATPNSQYANRKIWADFSVGSVYAVKAIKYP